MTTSKNISKIIFLAILLTLAFSSSAQAEDCKCVTLSNTYAHAKAIYKQKCELERGFFAPVCTKYTVNGEDSYTCSYKNAYKPWKGMPSLVNTCRMSYEGLCIGHSKNSNWGWNGEAPCQSAKYINKDACFDYDGDGWGWNGQKACYVPVGTEVIADVEAGFLNAPQPSAYDYLSRYPVCLGDEVDANHDGFGYENDASCVHIDQEVGEVVSIQDNQPDAEERNFPACSFTSFDADSDGFGWEDGKTCVVTSESAEGSPEPETVIAQNTTSTKPELPACKYSKSDPDKDGFGWEDGETCMMTSASTGVIPVPVVEEVAEQAAVNYTVCKYTSSDGDNDGFGWENGESCRVTSKSVDEIAARTVVAPPAAATAPATATAQISNENNEAPEAITAKAGRSTYKGYCHDNDGDGFGDNNVIGQSCRVTESNRADYGQPLDFTQISRNYGNNNIREGSCLDIDQDGFGGNTKNNSISCDSTEEPAEGPLNFRKCYPLDELHLGAYTVQNNQWNSSAMFNRNFWSCIELKGDNRNPVYSWTYDYLRESDGQPGQVKAYIQAFYGEKDGASPSGGDASKTEFPLTVGELRNIEVDYEFSENGYGERNVAIESFFHTGGCNVRDNHNYDTRDANYRHVEMMVWVGRPVVRRPGNTYIGKHRIDGRDWHLWLNSKLEWTYLAYASEETIPKGTLDWNAFTDFTKDWLNKNAHKYKTRNGRTLAKLTDDMCMPGVEMGTEIFWGKGQFFLDKFDVRTN